jgi:hypothetical protein
LPALTPGEFHERIALFRSLLGSTQPLTKEQAAEAIRLWNTAAYYPALANAAPGAEYIEQVRQKFAERVAPALEMDVGKGFALHSDELDLTFGGNLPEGSRYRIEDLEEP